jgi:hypothetical protein
VWNGPVGVFDTRNSRRHARWLPTRLQNRQGLLDCRRRRHAGCHRQVRITDGISYISTGGGAFLEFLEGKSCRRWRFLKSAPAARPPRERAIFRATKIVATVGPASNEYAVLKEMIDAGVDVFRLNFSHGTAGRSRQASQRDPRGSKQRRP